MGFKNRGYKREIPQKLVRDYKLFAIACEGSVREPEYFKLFQYLSSKVKIDIIEEYLNEEETVVCTKSSPNWVLNKAAKYIAENNLLDEDELWFVLDVDRWTAKQIYGLVSYCKSNSNWHVVLSNPCFEVWLNFHQRKTIRRSLTTCKDLKKELATFDKAGYNRFNYIQKITTAISNSRNADSNPNHFFPELKETKVYLLADALIQSGSYEEFNKFITITIPKLIEEHKAKIKNRKKR